MIARRDVKGFQDECAPSIPMCSSLWRHLEQRGMIIYEQPVSLPVHGFILFIVSFSRISPNTASKLPHLMGHLMKSRKNKKLRLVFYYFIHSYPQYIHACLAFDADQLFLFHLLLVTLPLLPISSPLSPRLLTVLQGGTCTPLRPLRVFSSFVVRMGFICLVRTSRRQVRPLH